MPARSIAAQKRLSRDQANSTFSDEAKSAPRA
jgi:hypothetical protein